MGPRILLLASCYLRAVPAGKRTRAPLPRPERSRVGSSRGRRAACRGAVALAAALALAACSTEAPPPSAEAESQLPTPLALEAVDLGFVHDNGARGNFYYPEMMQGGGGLLDFDGDGLLDIYLVQSGPLPPTGDAAAANVLLRNLGDLQFEDVTAQAGVGDTGYGSGLAVGDIDGDGWTDLYVTNLGANRLYRNRADGTFEDITERSGAGTGGYSTCAAFFDMEGDGDLDLFVCNYVQWSPATERRCLGFNGQQGYCGPHEYEPAPNVLLRNDGGRFLHVSATAGIQATSGATLGLAVADFDADGDLDLYTANDQMANGLWINDGAGRFRDEALERGAAYNVQGRPEAGMGVAAEDFDQNGTIDLFVTHLGGETNTLYLNEGGLFRDATQETGLASVSQAFTGFGVVLHDLDGDGERDLLLAHGRVSHGDDLSPDFSEPNQLLLGRADGSFVLAALPGPARVSRAIAVGDLDNSGRPAALIVENGAAAQIFRARAAAESWLGALVLATSDATSGIRGYALHAEVTLTTSLRRLTRRVETSHSYASAADPRVVFTLRPGEVARELAVRWPDGREAQLSEPRLGAVHHIPPP